MSSDQVKTAIRLPKRERGKQRVEQLLRAATEVFNEKGYEAATMTEIAARADAPIGSLYQFFPAKESLADTLVQNYMSLLAADLDALQAKAAGFTPRLLADALVDLFRGHAQARSAAIKLAEARMDEGTRRTTFRYTLRRHLASILRTRHPTLPMERARDMAIVLLQLMKALNGLHIETGLQGRGAASADLQQLMETYLVRCEAEFGSRLPGGDSPPGR